MSEEQSLTNIKELLKEEVADLSGYDEKFLLRRINKRMNGKPLTTITDYYNHLLGNEAERHALALDLAINVTHFMRDKTPFEFFRQEILPKVKENKRLGDEILIWSAGCASGEEPYSIAMSIYEAYGRFVPNYRIKIIATDMNESALSYARTGMYESQQFKDTDPQMMIKYLIDLKDGRFEVKKHLKEMIEFRQHNLLEEKAPGKFDVIFCRNTVIYFSSEAKEKLFAGFCEALKTGGYLVIGKTETLPSSVQPRFETLSIPERAYRKKD